MMSHMLANHCNMYSSIIIHHPFYPGAIHRLTLNEIQLHLPQDAGVSFCCHFRASFAGGTHRGGAAVHQQNKRLARGTCTTRRLTDADMPQILKSATCAWRA